jgi:DNA-binding transcriptional ArsR family regulator
MGMDTTTSPQTTRRLVERRRSAAGPPLVRPADSCCESETAPPSLDPARAGVLAERLKALADPTRLCILDLLAQQPESLCVCEITPRFPQNQPTISHHLKLLREAGLIQGEKRGVWSYYRATEVGKEGLALVKSVG